MNARRGRVPHVKAIFDDISRELWSNTDYKEWVYEEKVAKERELLWERLGIPQRRIDDDVALSGKYMVRNAEWQLWSFFTFNEQPTGYLSGSSIEGGVPGVNIELEKYRVENSYGADGERFCIIAVDKLSDDLWVLWLYDSHAGGDRLNYVVKKGHQLYSFTGGYNGSILAHVVQQNVQPLHDPVIVDTPILDETLPLPDLSRLPIPLASPTQKSKFNAEFFLGLDGSTATYPLTVNMARYFLGLISKSEEHFYDSYINAFDYGDERRFFLQKDLKTWKQQEQNPPLNHNGTSSAYTLLIDGETDLIFVVAPSEQELALVKEKGMQLVLTPVVSEAFVFMVNEDNPVKNLTLEQLQAIYRGEITNWQQVGGRNQLIVAYQRDEESGSQRAMRQLVMQGQPMIKASDAWVQHGMGGLARTAFPFEGGLGSIGYSYRFCIDQMRQNSQHSLKFLAIDGVYPDDSAIQEGRYAFVIPYYAVHRAGETDETVLAFVEWLRSPIAHRIMKEVGYLPAVARENDVVIVPEKKASPLTVSKKKAKRNKKT